MIVEERMRPLPPRLAASLNWISDTSRRDIGELRWATQLLKRLQHRSQLRTGKVQLTLCPEDVAIEVGYPLTAARRDIEIAYRRLNLRSDVFPIELRIFVNHVCRRIVAERFVQPDFLKFVEQRICLFEIVGITKLTDQIGGAQQQTLLLDQVVVVRG